MILGPKSPQPPLLFLGCLLAGWGAGRLLPWGLGLPGQARLGTGALMVGLGVGLAGWGLLTFRRMGTTPEPNGTASALLTSGPFRFSRNPLYLAQLATLAGLGFLLDSVWILVLVPAQALLLDRLVIAREEVRLRAQFGAAYEAYVRRVRRWL